MSQPKPPTHLHPMTSPIDIDRLERLAREATPGPWRVPPSGDVVHGEAYDLLAIIYESGADAEYVAAVSPDVLLKLLEVVRAAAAYRNRVGDARTDIDVLVALEALAQS